MKYYFIIEVYSDDREVDQYGLVADLNPDKNYIIEETVEDMILDDEEIWAELYENHVDNWGDYNSDDPEDFEEWCASIGPHATIVNPNDQEMIEYFMTLARIEL